MEKRHIEVTQKIWSKFYPTENFFESDKRLVAIKLFFDFFISNDGNNYLKNLEITKSHNIFLDIQRLDKLLPFPDFESSLRFKPKEVLGCVGIALSLYAIENLGSQKPIVFHPSFYNMSKSTDFSEIKAGLVGQLVSLKGHVTRVAPNRPLIESGSFLCSKCGAKTFMVFEDGIFQPPNVCKTEK